MHFPKKKVALSAFPKKFKKYIYLWKYLYFQIHKDNKLETEEQIREALKSLMKPEEVEDELRKAIEGLNLEESSA